MKRGLAFALATMGSVLLLLGTVSCKVDSDDAPSVYTVTFDTDGGSAVTKQSVEEGKTATQPAAPTKTGYDFSGWYKDGVAFNFSTAISADTTLRAKWTATVYTITYVLNDGTNAATNPTTYTIETPRTVLSAPTRADYAFAGWFAASGNAITAVGGGTTGKMTLYAKWRANSSSTWCVVFDTDGGSYVESQYVIDGRTAIRPVAPTKSGYVFAGWYFDSDLNYQFDFDYPISDNITLYARWEDVSDELLLVVFDTNGGSYVESQRVADGQTAIQPFDPTKDGYTFVGWYSDSDLTFQFDFGWAITGNIRLYAKWEVVPSEIWTVIFDTNGGGYVESQRVANGQNAAQPSDPTKDGYIFRGWYTSNDLTEQFDFNQEITRDITLYVWWEAVPDETWTVIFDTNGGSYVEPQLVADGQNAAQPSAPTKDGYILIGWFTDSGLTDQFDFGTVVTANITLYAKWEAKPHFSIEHTEIVADNKTADETILYLTEDTVLVFSGGINAYMIKKIIEAMKTNSSVKIALDLTETTGLSSIEADYFSGCTTLAGIVVPATVTSIEAGAFAGCTALREAVMADGSETLKLEYASGANNVNHLFYDCPLEKVYIGRELSVYGYYGAPFDGKTFDLEIGSAVTTFEDGTFAGCKPTKVCYDGTLEQWLGINFSNWNSNPCSYGADGADLYINGERITDVTIPDGVTSIGSYAFYGCSGLTSVTIPDSVTSIGICAFSGCDGLTEVHYNGTLEQWLDIDFIGAWCNGSDLYISGERITDVTIPDGVTSIGNGVFAGCIWLTSVTIPNSVTSIGSYAFFKCSRLTNVTIPDSVISIGSYAFYECTGLTSVTIPENVTNIENYAFCGCTALKKVIIADGNEMLTLGDDSSYNTGVNFIFYNCPLETVYLGRNLYDFSDFNYGSLFYKKTTLLSVEIGDKVTSIDTYAFYGCSGLTSVTIGAGVTSIENYAFDGCDGITTVYYHGSEAQWSAINIASTNTSLINAARTCTGTGN